MNEDCCFLNPKLLIPLGIGILLCGGALIGDAYYYNDTDFKNHIMFAGVVFGIGLFLTGVGIWKSCRNFRVNGVSNNEVVEIIATVKPSAEITPGNDN